MKYAIARRKVLNSLVRSYYNRKSQLIADRKRDKFALSYKLCGQSFDAARPSLKVRCGKSVCPYCSKRWANKLTKTFLCQTDSRDNADYKMITIMISLHADSKGCLDEFKTFRNRVHKTIGKAREGKKRDPEISAMWKDFTMFGSAEIDVFYKDDFTKLGAQKQESFLKDFKYEKDEFVSNAIYVLHYHAVVYLGKLSESAVRKRLKRYAGSVHFKELDVTKAFEDNARDIIGYGSKVCFDRTLKDNKKVEWKQNEIDSYIDHSIYRSGRKAFKFGVKRKRRV